jgi:cell fate (sporulation/competence/biofilm development) regulator YlbF (YheA/YmcA/DUF963 family)
MRNMEEALVGLIGAIKESDEYLEYTRAKEKVKEFPELKALIDEYRWRNYELQNDENIGFEKVEEFEKEFAELWENPLAADFLEAELAFCRMMQEVNLRITESLDFE